MNIFLVIFGMTLATYIPRLAPVFIVDKIKLPNWINQWLKMIPFAALGALIFPGILTIEKELPVVGLVGGLVAVVSAYFKLHIFYVILSSIAAVMLMKVLV